jgi:CubicO group peptidase (beta-lactamase class C family)
MKNLILAATIAALSVTSPATAQSAQERLDKRYNRALAAGYKALMLCSGISSSERVGKGRTAEHIHEWELTGIYPSLDPIIRELPYKVVRGAPIEFRSPKEGFVRHVEVEWAKDMPPRVAEYRGRDGCAVMPIGIDPATLIDRTAEFRRATLSVAPPIVEASERLLVARGLKTQEQIDRAHAEFQAVASEAFGDAYGEGSRTTAVLISQNDRMRFEGFADGYSRSTPQRTWSVAKSIAATIVGMAVLDGAVDVNQSAGAGYGEDDPRSAITIDHMLRMASGRYSDTPGNRTDPLYWGGTTVDERASNWPLVHEPGTVFRYANNDTLIAVQAIRAWMEEKGVHRLADLLAMFDASIEGDWQGNRVLSSQVWASGADLIALGQLYLGDGVHWSGERRLPEGWVEYVSAPSGPQPEGRDWGYGASWWLLNQSEGVPADTFLAAGNRGQYVVVVPSREVVIVRRGEDMVGTRFDIAAFKRDVLAALEN